MSIIGGRAGPTPKLGRLGCFGCHDIKGFEDAKPIGTPLNDWGKKDAERLAFEHITEYVEKKQEELKDKKARAPVTWSGSVSRRRARARVPAPALSLSGGCTTA